MAGFLGALQTEWWKIKNYRTFWILIIVITVCVPAFNYMIYDFTDNNFPKINGKSLLGNPFSFPNVWKMVPYNAGLVSFMPAILIITLFTNEYTFRTHRQNIIDGWSRSRFILLKLTEVFMLAIYVSLLVFLTAIFFGYLTRNTSSQSFSGGWVNYRYSFFLLIELLDYLFIAALIAMFVKRAGLAMGIFFLYMFVEQLIVAVGRNKYKVTWVDYLPQEVSDRLIPNPLGGKMLSGDKTAIWEAQIPVYLSIAIIYILIYIVCMIWRFRKTDL